MPESSFEVVGIPPETETKICNKCGIEKILDEFSPQKNGILGRRSICKECRRVKRGDEREVLKGLGTNVDFVKRVFIEAAKEILMEKIE